MEQTLKVQPGKINGRVAIIIFTAIAIVLRIVGYFGTVINNLLSLFSGIFDYIIMCIVEGRTILPSYIEARFNHILEYEFNIGDLLLSLFSVTFYAFLNVLPYALIILYVAFFYKKTKATVLVPVAFGLLCLKDVTSILHSTIIYIEDIFTYYVVDYSVGDIISYVISCIISVLFTLPYVIIFALLTISALKGFTNKPLAIVPSAVGIVCYVLAASYSLFTILPMVIMGLTGYTLPYGDMLILLLSLIPTSINTVAFISFFVAIIIFAAKNYIPEIIPMSQAKLERLIATKPDKARAILTTRYETGKLIEEEYNSRIAEIENREPTL